MAPHPDPIRVLGQRQPLLLEPPPLHQVISVHPRHQLPTARREPGVQRRHDSAVWRVHDAESRIRSRKPLDDARRPIRRPIVDDDALPVAVTLPLHTAQRRPDRPLRVVGGHQHRNRDHLPRRLPHAVRRAPRAQNCHEPTATTEALGVLGRPS